MPPPIALGLAAVAIVLPAIALAARTVRHHRRRPRTKTKTPCVPKEGARGGTDIMATSTERLPLRNDAEALPEFAPRRTVNDAYDYPFEGWKPSWVDSSTPRYDDACARSCEADARKAVRRTNGPDAVPVGNVSMRCRHDCAYY